LRRGRNKFSNRYGSPNRRFVSHFGRKDEKPRGLICQQVCVKSRRQQPGTASKSLVTFKKAWPISEYILKNAKSSVQVASK